VPPLDFRSRKSRRGHRSTAQDRRGDRGRKAKLSKFHKGLSQEAVIIVVAVAALDDVPMTVVARMLRGKA
jgi:hypothetical protein